MNALPTGKSNSSKALILHNAVRGHNAVQGSLYDGHVWTEGSTVKLRKQGESGFHKSDTLFVDMPNPTEGQPSLAAGLKGFTKCKCMGVMICNNDKCVHLQHYGTKSETYARQGKHLICKGEDNLGCKLPMTCVGECGTVQKYRITLVHGSDNTQKKTAIVYNGKHSEVCEAHCAGKCKDFKTEELGDSNTITERVKQGVAELTMSVIETARGAHKTATQHGEKGRMLLQNTGLKHMKQNTNKKDLNNMTVEQATQYLKSSTGMVVVPYHTALGSLSVGPTATVIIQGCCRTAADWQLCGNREEYKYSCVNLMLAGCDDKRVRDLMDEETVEKMKVPVSYDVQHPNKVSGHFTLGYFAYVPGFRMMVNLANVMIPATDGYNGHNAKMGDTTQGNSNAKLALDLALRMHLKCAFPEEDWNNFSYTAQGARVADEGNAGIQGQRSTDGDKDVAEASCQFHFLQAVDRIKKDFSKNENFKMFSNMAIGMMNEELQEVFWGLFDECMRMLADMRNEDKGVTAACGFLRWHFSNKERRDRVVTAFKPLGSSKSSVAEIGHAQVQRLGRKGITLVQALIMDSGHMERQSSDINNLMTKNEVVRRRRGHDEYTDKIRKAVEAGNVQRRVSNFSAVGQLRMKNIYGGNWQNELDSDVNKDAGIISVCKEVTPVLFGGNLKSAMDSAVDNDGLRMQLKEKETGEDTEIISVCKQVTPVKGMVVGCRRSPRLAAEYLRSPGEEAELCRQNHAKMDVGSAEIRKKMEQYGFGNNVGKEVDAIGTIVIDERLLSVTQGNEGFGELEMVDTHRFDKNTLDIKAQSKEIYSNQPSGAQRKINGIRYSRVDDNGRLCYLLDVCGGTDIWADEKIVDPKDIDDYDQRIAHDLVQRNKDVSTEDRETKRYRTRMIDKSSVRAVARFRQPCGKKNDSKNIGRIKHSLKADNVVVMSCRGDANTIMEDGQVVAEVLFVWTNDANPSLYEKFEQVTLHIGYEPECFCGVNHAERPCVHLLGFFMRKCNISDEDPIMYQVALVTEELKKLKEVLVTSNALQIDACGTRRMNDLIRKEHMLVLRGSETRSIGNENNGRQEAIGANLKELQKSIKDKLYKSGKPITSSIATSKQAHKALTPVAKALRTVIDMGGEAAVMAKMMCASPCQVMIESPKVMQNSKKRKVLENGEPATESKRRKKVDIMKPPPNLPDLPPGEARIYRSWSVTRKCFGSDCYKQILKGEWFVCLPMRNNHAISRGSSKVQMYGFCLKDGGACLDKPDVWVGRGMKTQSISIVQCLPVHIHGKQSCNAECLEELGRKLYKRPKPYLVMK